MNIYFYDTCIIKHGQNFGFAKRLLSKLVNPLSFCITYHCNHLYGMVSEKFLCAIRHFGSWEPKGFFRSKGRFKSFAKNQEVSVYWPPFPPQKEFSPKPFYWLPVTSGNWGLIGMTHTKKGNHASWHWYERGDHSKHAPILSNLFCLSNRIWTL